MKTFQGNKIIQTAEKILLCVFLILIFLINIFTPVKLFAESAVLTIKVSLINHAPVLDPIPDITVHAGDKVIFTPTAADEEGNILTYSYSGWMNDSVYTTNLNDVINNDATEHFVTVTVSDGGLTDSRAAKVTVCVNYSPLRIINIKPRGLDGITASNRIFRAYPGIEYNIKAAVLGGMYPYQFTWEANKPSWLSMDNNTGEISGIAPASGLFNDIKIRITDSKGSSITAQWSIEVTTQKFIFLDAVKGNLSIRNGGTGTGTIDNPFKNVKDWYGTASSDISGFNDYQDYFVYYRTGIYYLDGYLDANRNMSCNGSKPSVHLAYPGEYPKFNMENGKTWESPVYADGLEFYNMLGYGIITLAGNNYNTFRNLYMHGLDPASGINGQGFISVLADSTQGNYWIWQDCKFDSSKQNGIEINNLDNSLIENCVFTNFLTNNLDTTSNPISTDVKCRNLTIRNNIIYGNEGKGIFAYLAAENPDINNRSSNIEICFNNIFDCAEAGLSINTGTNGIQGFYVYRNTIQSNNTEASINIEYAGNNPPEGPYVFKNNIIVNPNLKYFVFMGCSADVMNYVKINDNLFDSTANNIVDPAGNITYFYAQYLGTYGWQKTNTPPVLNPIADITLNAGQTVTFNPSATDKESSLLTYAYSGWITSASYVTNYSDAGVHYVTVTVSDGTLTNSKTVKVTVIDVNTNSAPTAISQNFTTNEDTVLNITLSGSDLDKNTLTYSIVNQPVHGTVSGTAPNVTYKPRPNYNGNDSFTFKTFDGKLYSNTATVSIKINPVNDAPVLNPIANITVNEGKKVTINPSATDIDSNILTYTYSGWMTSSSYVTNYNDAGVHYVTVTVSDGALTNSKTVKVTVINVNRIPTAISQSLITNEDSALNITLSGTDPDNDALTYSLVTLPIHGALSGSAPNVTYKPNLNYNSTDSFTFRVYDGKTNSNTGTVSIKINPVNDVPVLNSIGDKVVLGAKMEFTIYASDVENNTLTYTAGNLPTGANFNPLTHTFTWIPDYNQASLNYPNVLFTVTDNGIPPASCSESITITTGAINHPPVLNPIGNKTVKEGELLEFTVTGFDTDGDNLTYTAGNLPAGSDFDQLTQIFTWTPGYNQSANYTNILFTVSDNNIPPETDSKSITITVGDMNHPPVLNPIGNKAVKENALLEFFITGTDEDNNVLTYSANNLPAGAAFDSSSQKFQWYPQYNQAGNYESVLFTVTDNGVPPVSSSETITITVGNVNHPPVLNPIGNKAVAAGELLEFVITGSDVDGDILTYTAANLPPGAYFNPSTQTFTWTPGYSQSAIYTNIIFTVTDNGASPASKNESIIITVLSPGAI
ncbi:MAG: Ig-like domain-containing protein [bacterium]|nr:Ig-like domain-containing protein [bacterium]